MADPLRCPNCGQEVVPLSLVDGRMVIQVELPKATIYSARVRCPDCGMWIHFSAKKLEVASA
ncbi:MAG TPA: hypothetical protein VJP78_02165 [Thermoleophilia bacterium]|nr:hypothetical protein [Thermoleophilia bacterium]